MLQIDPEAVAELVEQLRANDAIHPKFAAALSALSARVQEAERLTSLLEDARRSYAGLRSDFERQTKALTEAQRAWSAASDLRARAEERAEAAEKRVEELTAALTAIRDTAASWIPGDAAVIRLVAERALTGGEG